MFRQLVRKSALVSSRVQKRSLHSPFVVLSGSKGHSASESKQEAAATTQYEHAQSETKEQSNANFEFESADQHGPRVYVVSQPDPNLGAPFGVRLGAYPVSEPFA